MDPHPQKFRNLVCQWLGLEKTCTTKKRDICINNLLVPNERRILYFLRSEISEALLSKNSHIKKQNCFAYFKMEEVLLKKKESDQEHIWLYELLTWFGHCTLRPHTCLDPWKFWKILQYTLLIPWKLELAVQMVQIFL